MILKKGESQRFDYTGNIQSITLLPGKYRLECYGASGGIGNGNINPVGKGGYISGELLITEIMTIYIHVGQDGVDNWTTSVRYNGGGAAISVGGHNGGAGGGATDFRLSSAAWNNVESLKTRILVAGGGGGWYGGTSGYTSGGGGGSSYAAGYSDCDNTYHESHQQNIVLQNVNYQQGVNNGNGYAIITMLEDTLVRTNSNYYRDSYYQEHFDFNKLLEV